MQPCKRTRMSITKHNQAPRFTDEELVSNFSVDQRVQDGQDDAVKRGPLVHVEQRSVEASAIEGEELQQSTTMPSIEECQLTRNPVELEDSECTDSLIEMFVSLGTSNTSARPVVCINHPPLQPTISRKKDKGVLTQSPRTPKTVSQRHVASRSSDHRSPRTNQPRLSVKNSKGAVTRNKSYEAEQLVWALAESKKEYEKTQRSIHGSTSSHAAAVDYDIGEPAKGDSKDENDVAEALIILSNGKPKDNSKDKKDDDDDDLGGSKVVKMRSMLSILKDC